MTCQKPKTINRIIASFVLVAFTLTTHTNAGYASLAAPMAAGIEFKTAPLEVSAVQMPLQIGKIEESFKGASNEAVIVIQDAHAIPDAQKNIQRIIGFFQKQYGVRRVGLEGASSRLDPQIFKSFPDKKMLRQIFSQYLNQGELTAGTGAAIFSEGPAANTIFQGVEDWNLYEQGFGLYLAAIQQEEVISGKLEAWNLSLNEQKEKIYPAELIELDKKLQAFHRNEMDLMEVFKALLAVQKPARGTELYAFMEEMDSEKADNSAIEAEVNRIARLVAKHLNAKSPTPETNKDLQLYHDKLQDFRISRLSAQAFALFLKELIAKDKLGVTVSAKLLGGIENQKKMRDLEGTKFFRDFEAYEKRVKQSLMHNQEQRALDAETEELEIAEKLMKLELSREEWARFSGREIIQAGEFVRPEDFKLHEAFYKNAEARDAAFLKNLENGFGSDPKSAVLVAGGFHAQGLTRRLKEKNVSYLLIMPEIQNIPKETHYQAQMRDDVSWKGYFKTENGKIDFYKAFVRATRDKLLQTDESKFILKNWRDQIIRDLADKKQIQKAGEYTQFLDEVLGNQNKSQDAKLKAAFEKIEKFVAGLRGLKERDELTDLNIMKLVKPGAVLPRAPGLAIAPDSFGRANLTAAAAEGIQFGGARFEARPEITAGNSRDKMVIAAAPREAGSSTLSIRELAALAGNPDSYDIKEEGNKIVLKVTIGSTPWVLSVGSDGRSGGEASIEGRDFESAKLNARNIPLLLTAQTLSNLLQAKKNAAASKPSAAAVPGVTPEIAGRLNQIGLAPSVEVQQDIQAFDSGKYKDRPILMVDGAFTSYYMLGSDLQNLRNPAGQETLAGKVTGPELLSNGKNQYTYTVLVKRQSAENPSENQYWRLTYKRNQDPANPTPAELDRDDSLVVELDVDRRDFSPARQLENENLSSFGTRVLHRFKSPEAERYFTPVVAAVAEAALRARAETRSGPGPDSSGEERFRREELAKRGVVAETRQGPGPDSSGEERFRREAALRARSENRIPVLKSVSAEIDAFEKKELAQQRVFDKPAVVDRLQSLQDRLGYPMQKFVGAGNEGDVYRVQTPDGKDSAVKLAGGLFWDAGPDIARENLAEAVKNANEFRSFITANGKINNPSYAIPVFYGIVQPAQEGKADKGIEVPGQEDFKKMERIDAVVSEFIGGVDLEFALADGSLTLEAALQKFEAFIRDLAEAGRQFIDSREGAFKFRDGKLVVVDLGILTKFKETDNLEIIVERNKERFTEYFEKFVPGRAAETTDFVERSARAENRDMTPEKAVTVISQRILGGTLQPEKISEEKLPEKYRGKGIEVYALKNEGEDGRASAGVAVLQPMSLTGDNLFYAMNPAKNVWKGEKAVKIGDQLFSVTVYQKNETPPASPLTLEQNKRELALSFLTGMRVGYQVHASLEEDVALRLRQSPKEGVLKSEETSGNRGYQDILVQGINKNGTVPASLFTRGDSMNPSHRAVTGFAVGLEAIAVKQAKQSGLSYGTALSSFYLPGNSQGTVPYYAPNAEPLVSIALAVRGNIDFQGRPSTDYYNFLVPESIFQQIRETLETDPAILYEAILRRSPSPLGILVNERLRLAEGQSIRDLPLPAVLSINSSKGQYEVNGKLEPAVMDRSSMQLMEMLQYRAENREESLLDSSALKAVVASQVLYEPPPANDFKKNIGGVYAAIQAAQEKAQTEALFKSVSAIETRRNIDTFINAPAPLLLKSPDEVIVETEEEVPAQQSPSELRKVKRAEILKQGETVRSNVEKKAEAEEKAAAAQQKRTYEYKAWWGANGNKFLPFGNSFEMPKFIAAKLPSMKLLTFRKSLINRIFGSLFALDARIQTFFQNLMGRMDRDSREWSLIGVGVTVMGVLTAALVLTALGMTLFGIYSGVLGIVGGVYTIRKMLRVTPEESEGGETPSAQSFRFRVSKALLPETRQNIIANIQQFGADYSRKLEEQGFDLSERVDVISTRYANLYSLRQGELTIDLYQPYDADGFPTGIFRLAKKARKTGSPLPKPKKSAPLPPVPEIAAPKPVVKAAEPKAQAPFRNSDDGSEAAIVLDNVLAQLSEQGNTKNVYVIVKGRPLPARVSPYVFYEDGNEVFLNDGTLVRPEDIERVYRVRADKTNEYLFNREDFEPLAEIPLAVPVAAEKAEAPAGEFQELSGTPDQILGDLLTELAEQSETSGSLYVAGKNGRAPLLLGDRVLDDTGKYLVLANGRLLPIADVNTLYAETADGNRSVLFTREEAQIVETPSAADTVPEMTAFSDTTELPVPVSDDFAPMLSSDELVPFMPLPDEAGGENLPLPYPEDLPQDLAPEVSQEDVTARQNERLFAVLDALFTNISGDLYVSAPNIAAGPLQLEPTMTDGEFIIVEGGLNLVASEIFRVFRRSSSGYLVPLFSRDENPDSLAAATANVLINQYELFDISRALTRRSRGVGAGDDDDDLLSMTMNFENITEEDISVDRDSREIIIRAVQTNSEKGETPQSVNIDYRILIPPSLSLDGFSDAELVRKIEAAIRREKITFNTVRAEQRTQERTPPPLNTAGPKLPPALNGIAFQVRIPTPVQAQRLQFQRPANMPALPGALPTGSIPEILASMASRDMANNIKQLLALNELSKAGTDVPAFTRDQVQMMGKALSGSMGLNTGIPAWGTFAVFVLQVLEFHPQSLSKDYRDYLVRYLTRFYTEGPGKDYPKGLETLKRIQQGDKAEAFQDLQKLVPAGMPDFEIKKTESIRPGELVRFGTSSASVFRFDFVNGTYSLVNTTDSSQRFNLTIGVDYELGRKPGVDIQIQGDGISRSHASIRVGVDGLRITDLGSRNGTYISAARRFENRQQEATRRVVTSPVTAQLDGLIGQIKNGDQEYIQNLISAGLRDILLTLDGKNPEFEPGNGFAFRSKLVSWIVESFEGVEPAVLRAAVVDVLVNRFGVDRETIELRDLNAEVQSAQNQLTDDMRRVIAATVALISATDASASRQALGILNPQTPVPDITREIARVYTTTQKAGPSFAGQRFARARGLIAKTLTLNSSDDSVLQALDQREILLALVTISEKPPAEAAASRPATPQASPFVRQAEILPEGFLRNIHQWITQQDLYGQLTPKPAVRTGFLGGIANLVMGEEEAAPAKSPDFYTVLRALDYLASENPSAPGRSASPEEKTAFALSKNEQFWNSFGTGLPQVLSHLTPLVAEASAIAQSLVSAVPVSSLESSRRSIGDGFIPSSLLDAIHSQFPDAGNARALVELQVNYELRRALGIVRSEQRERAQDHAAGIITAYQQENNDAVIGHFDAILNSIARKLEREDVDAARQMYAGLMRYPGIPQGAVNLVRDRLAIVQSLVYNQPLPVRALQNELARKVEGYTAEKSLGEIAEMYSGEENKNGFLFFERLGDYEKALVRSQLSADGLRRLQADLFSEVTAYDILFRKGVDSGKDLNERANKVQLEALQQQVFKIGARIPFQAHGVKNGFSSFLRVILDGKIRAQGVAPLTDGTQRDSVAGPHGPFYVVVDTQNPDGSSWQNRENHVVYLVPEEADRQVLIRAVSTAASEGIITSRVAGQILPKIKTYEQFVDNPPAKAEAPGKAKQPSAPVRAEARIEEKAQESVEQPTREITESERSVAGQAAVNIAFNDAITQDEAGTVRIIYNELGEDKLVEIFNEAIEIHAKNLISKNPESADDVTDWKFAMTEMLGSLRSRADLSPAARQSLVIGFIVGPQLEPSFKKTLLEVLSKDAEVGTLVMTGKLRDADLSTKLRQMGKNIRLVNDLSRPSQVDETDVPVAEAGGTLDFNRLHKSFIPFKSDLTGLENNPLAKDYVQQLEVVSLIITADLLSRDPKMSRELLRAELIKQLGREFATRDVISIDEKTGLFSINGQNAWAAGLAIGRAARQKAARSA